MLKRIDKLMCLHEEETARLQLAYDKDKQLVMKELSDWMKLSHVEGVDTQAVQAHINELTQKMIDLEKKRTLNAVNTNGIIKAANVINRMMGFDITKVEVQQVDTEREQMEQLSADELRQLINISKKDSE